MKRSNMGIRYFFVLCFFAFCTYAQNTKKLNIDSLKQVIATTKYDTTKVNSLCVLAYEIRRKALDEALEHISKAIELAKK